jgi:integrase
VDLDPTTCALLARHVDDRGGRSDGYVFSDDGGATAWKPNRVTNVFIRHRRGAGLRPFRLHDLRHFMASEMLQAGVPIVVVSRRLDRGRYRARRGPVRRGPQAVRRGGVADLRRDATGAVPQRHRRRGGARTAARATAAR